MTAEPSDENPTCAVTLSSAQSVDDLVVAWRGALDDVVAHRTVDVQQQVVRPRCLGHAVQREHRDPRPGDVPWLVWPEPPP